MLGLRNYYFLIPLVGAFLWDAMLITMMVCWAGQGHPSYAFIGHYQKVVYISHIGATNLQPVFICGAGAQGIFYCLTLITEHRLRRSGKLQYWFKKNERNLIFAGCIIGAIGQLGILLCACLNIKSFRPVHHGVLYMFVACVLISLICIMVEYLMMALHYRKIHVTHKLMNKFMVSFLLKLAWTIIAGVFALCFAAMPDDSVSAEFEWTLAFWYTFLFVIFAWDLFPAAKKAHKNSPYIKDWNNKGFYMYDQRFGVSALPEEFPEDEEFADVEEERTFTDAELSQYPLKNSETYAIPEGLNVEKYTFTT